MRAFLIRLSGWMLLVLLSTSARGAGITAEMAAAFAGDDSEAKVKAIAAVPSLPQPFALSFLSALEEGRVKSSPDGRVFVETEQGTTDAVSGSAVTAVPEDAEELTINNRLRREIEVANAIVQLAADEVGVRLEAARLLRGGASELTLPYIQQAREREKDEAVAAALVLVQSSVELQSPQQNVRLRAVQALGKSDDPQVRVLLLESLRKEGSSFVEPDPSVRQAAASSIKSIERRMSINAVYANIFTGLSLGSVLLLAALGLAITYGLIGVINMAHGELVMIGAYTTYLVQNFFRMYLPGAFDWYPLAAIPAGFLVAAAVGIVMERTVIRFLYGRPLETLLATWGVSLILIQAVRTVFGAQNVAVENPAWLSGGWQVATNLVLPYSRIGIIVFAMLVLVAVWAMLTKTRLGLFVRAVTQNRAMADCTGVPTARVDMAAFGIGSGIAGLGGVALSQIGNVGPALGQSYIVDSFMVVVLGGVGQLAGTVYAALGLGLVNKLLEGQIGAVLAKIAILVFIILFIQKRPQGMFALKGRFVEN